MARIERNEGIHPTRLLTEMEADMRYTVAKGAIIAMARDLMNRSFYDSLVPVLALVKEAASPVAAVTGTDVLTAKVKALK